MISLREEKLMKAASQRQFDIAVVFENVWDPHNIAACLRSCDAIGVQDVYIISSSEKKQSKLGKKSSASASKWLSIHHYDDVEKCFQELRSNYFRIYSTRLEKDAVDLYSMNLMESMALVFGNEKEGVTPLTASLCDGNFLIPQMGLIQSLNISVACAVTLYECFRQRRAARFYEQERFAELSTQIFKRWMATM
jgi:tRNA (guanosine-2'-O-)-methyltransferase